MTGERREVQFLVERLCLRPINLKRSRRDPAFRALEAALPYPVWVWWPPERNRSDPERDCHTTLLYRVSPTGHDDILRRFGKPAEPAACICEHMGRLIE